MREARDDEARARPRAFEPLLQLREEVPVRAEGDRADVGAGQGHRDRVDGIGGLRHQAGIAGGDERPRDVADRFLRPHRDHHLGLRVQPDPVTVLVPFRDRPPEVRESTAGGVPVVPRITCRLGELVHDRLGGGEVGIAHAEVDHVLAGAARGRLQVVDDAEDVRGQPVDPSELLHADPSAELTRVPERGGGCEPGPGIP